MAPDRTRARTVRRRRAVALLAALATVLAVALVARSVLATDPHEIGPRDRTGQRASVEQLSIHSRAVHRTLDAQLVVPGGAPARTRGLLVLLHGRGRADDRVLDDTGYAALAKLGDRAPVVVAPADDGQSYWHDRSGAAWGRYVMDEVIPAALRRSGADPRRVAIGGVSMGGFGALDLARLHPRRFCSVTARSPALWEQGGDSAAGAFDDADDFARHDVVSVARTGPAAFRGTRLWLDGGTEDPFDRGIGAFADGLRAGGIPLAYRRWPGGHDHDYWAAHWAAALRFTADALAGCRRGA